MSATYTPNPAAERCIAYFRRLPDEELSIKDIALKFGFDAKAVADLLKGAVEAEILAVDGTIYSAGKKIAAQPVAASPIATNAFGAALKPAKALKKPTAPLELPDFDTLQVETDIPQCNPRAKGASKWQPLFDRLTEPGQSIKLPAAAKAAVGAAVNKQNRLKQGTFRVGLDAAGDTRIWRKA